MIKLNRGSKILIFALFLIAAVIFFAVLKNPSNLNPPASKSPAPEGTLLSESEARAIAESSCLQEGEFLASSSYNDYTKTWWFEANLNNPQKGCNPACVVSEETKSAEINWRCTGLVEPEEPQTNSECGIENCHGLEITCGPNIAEMCTMEYAAGDNCRQNASCEIINGVCQPVFSPKFETCKACVLECENQFSDDPEKNFSCESQCWEQ